MGDALPQCKKKIATKEVRHTTFKAFKMNTTEVLQIMCKNNSKNRKANHFFFFF